MARNGSGVYSPPGTDFPAVSGATIASAKYNNVINDIATALTGSLAANGETTVTANIPLAGYKLTGVGAATARTDAASLANTQDQTGTYVATVGGTADAITLTPSPAIAAYTAGQRFSFVASGANTGATTVAISGLVAKSVTKNGSTALAASDISSGQLVTITYDGSRFQVGSAPTAGMAAADILTAIKTVDGSGSGLDADLLDGISSASFAQLSSANFTALQLGGVNVGYLVIPRHATAGAAATTWNGKCNAVSAGFTIDNSVFAAGDAFMVFNDSGSAITVTRGTGLTMYNYAGTDSATISVPAHTSVSVWFNSASVCIVK